MGQLITTKIQTLYKPFETGQFSIKRS